MEKIRIEIQNETIEREAGITLLQLAKEYEKDGEADIVLANVNNKLTELYHPLHSDCQVEWVTTKTTCGNQSYKRSATLLMLKAFHDMTQEDEEASVMVQYSLSKGFYCIYTGKESLTEEFLLQVKGRMEQLVREDIPITKQTVGTDNAIEVFKKHKMYGKVKLFQFRRVSSVNLYRLSGFEDYFYGYMVPSTGYLKYFDLYLYDEGFVLQLPEKEKPDIVPDFKPQNKLFQVLKQSSSWSDTLEVPTVGALNEQISKGNMSDIILVSEALQEMKIADIAKRIQEENSKFVMIAGPSSSGKTSFSHRLSVQLKALGKKPHPIAVDNYFVNRDKTPKDEEGNYNFEILEALDVEQFNKDMTALEKGERVAMPTYNFKTGKREYKGDTMQLGGDDLLVIEGIHGLNDKLSYSLASESKFKIYISALTQLNIDEHNRIPTTDGRLLRRMVRDARTRGIGAAETISRWQSVRNGEEFHIFPYQEEADVMFNSALLYELSVLKQYAEPLLFGIPKEAPEYPEAKRLLKFLDYFLGVSSEEVPKNSLVREFIGGSVFDV